MTLIQITNYTSPNYTDRPQVNTHRIEHFFTGHDFWATCACPEKTELPWNFSLYWIYVSHSGFKNLRFPWKPSFPWKFSLYWIYFLPFRIFEQLCACPEKQNCPGIFHCTEYTFYIQEFWASCMRLPWKTELPWIHSTDYIFFYHSGFLSNLRFPWKTELPWNFSLYWNICYHSGFLRNLRLAWKTELPWYFHCVKHVFFIIQEFWVTRACPEKTELPQKFFAVLNIIFTFIIFEQLALALKNRGFPAFTVPNIYFLVFRSFE